MPNSQNVKEDTKWMQQGRILFERTNICLTRPLIANKGALREIASKCLLMEQYCKSAAGCSFQTSCRILGKPGAFHEFVACKQLIP